MGKSLEYRNDSITFNKNEFLFNNFYDFIKEKIIWVLAALPM